MMPAIHIVHHPFVRGFCIGRYWSNRGRSIRCLNAEDADPVRYALASAVRRHAQSGCVCGRDIGVSLNFLITSLQQDCAMSGQGRAHTRTHLYPARLLVSVRNPRCQLRIASMSSR